MFFWRKFEPICVVVWLKNIKFASSFLQSGIFCAPQKTVLSLNKYILPHVICSSPLSDSPSAHAH